MVFQSLQKKLLVKIPSKDKGSKKTDQADSTEVIPQIPNPGPRPATLGPEHCREQPWRCPSNARITPVDGSTSGCEGEVAIDTRMRDLTGSETTRARHQEGWEGQEADKWAGP